MELKIQNITKRYRDKTAVDDVSITLTPGVWGLLGANGAGKTTLMRMLAGILRPSSGRILCDGAMPMIGKTCGWSQARRPAIAYLMISNSRGRMRKQLTYSLILLFPLF